MFVWRPKSRLGDAMVPFLSAALAIARGNRNSIAPVKRAARGYHRKHTEKVIAKSSTSSFDNHERMPASLLQEQWAFLKPAAMGGAALKVRSCARPKLAGGRVLDWISAPWAAYSRNLGLSRGAKSLHTDSVLKSALLKEMSASIFAGSRDHAVSAHAHNSWRRGVGRALAGRSGARFLSDQRSFSPRKSNATLQHEPARNRFQMRENSYELSGNGSGEIPIPQDIGHARRSKGTSAVAINERARDVVEARRALTTCFDETIDDYFWRCLRVPPSGMTGYDSRVSPIWAGLQIPGS